MRAKIYITSVMLLSLCGCVSNNVKDGKLPPNAITFQVANYRTKAVSATKFAYESFGTVAYCDSVVTDGLYIDNEEVKLIGGVWRTETPYYWPKYSTVDFISYYPFNESGTCPVITRNSISYNDVVVDGSVDIMYASKAAGYGANTDEVTDDLEDGDDSGYNGVPALFHHALSKVNINVRTPYLKNGDYRWELSMKNVTISGIRNKGSLNLVAAPSGNGLIEWPLPASRVWDEPSGDETITLGDLAIDEANRDFALLTDRYFLPQELADSVQVLSFDYDIVTYYKDKAIMHESAGFEISLATASIPAWQINGSYLYNLILTPALTDSSDKAVEVTVDPAVVDWTYSNADLIIDIHKFRQKSNQILYTTTDGMPLEFSDMIVDLAAYIASGAHDDLDEFDQYAPRSFSDIRHIVSNDFNSDAGCYVLTLDDDVANIGLDYAFTMMPTLETLSLPEGNYPVGVAMCALCESLTSVKFPAGLTGYGICAFANTMITSLNVPDTVKDIPDLLCIECECLREVSIGKNVETVGDFAFFYCYDIIDFEINSNKLKSVGRYAWPDKEFIFGPLILPPTMETVGECAYEGWWSVSSLVIPDSVTSIGAGSFGGLGNARTIMIGSGITEIPYEAFEDCCSVRSFEVPATVKKIGTSVFYYWDDLEELILNEGLEYMGARLFEYCYDLETLTIPSTVKAVGNKMIRYNCNINTVYCKAVVPPVRGAIEDEIYPYDVGVFMSYWEDDEEYQRSLEDRANEEFRVFSDVRSELVIYVPKGSLEAYENAPGWSCAAGHYQEYEF